MANTTYKELADAVFNKIKDHSFCEMTEEIAYNIVISYLRPAIINYQSCKQDLSKRDDELQVFYIKLSDETFIILVNYMVIEWLTSNYILTSSNLKPRLSPSDFHSLGLKDMLQKAIDLRSELMDENNQLAINKSYNNSNIFDMVKKRKKV